MNKTPGWCLFFTHWQAKGTKCTKWSVLLLKVYAWVSHYPSCALSVRTIQFCLVYNIFFKIAFPSSDVFCCLLSFPSSLGFQQLFFNGHCRLKCLDFHTYQNSLWIFLKKGKYFKAGLKYLFFLLSILCVCLLIYLYESPRIKWSPYFISPLASIKFQILVKFHK